MADKPSWLSTWLLHQQGRSVREIAFALDLSDRTVEDRIRQARRYYREREPLSERTSMYSDPAIKEWMEKRMERFLEK